DYCAPSKVTLQFLYRRFCNLHPIFWLGWLSDKLSDFCCEIQPLLPPDVFGPFSKFILYLGQCFRPSIYRRLTFVLVSGPEHHVFVPFYFISEVFQVASQFNHYFGNVLAMGSGPINNDSGQGRDTASRCEVAGKSWFLECAAHRFRYFLSK